jgi:hypothetical protein
MEIGQKLKPYKTVPEIPAIVRLEVRQKIALGIGLELCSLYCPEVIAPNVLKMLAKIEKRGWTGFICVCGGWVKCEQSWRCHLTAHHRKLMEYYCIFQNEYFRIPKLDLTLLGNTKR